MTFSHPFHSSIPLSRDQPYTFHPLIPHIIFIFHQVNHFFFLILHSNSISNLIIPNTFFLKITIYLNHFRVSQFIIFIIPRDLLNTKYGFHIPGSLLKMNVISLSLIPFNHTTISID